VRQAPPVRVEVLPPHLWRVLNVGLPALTLGVLVAWAGQHLRMATGSWLAAAMLCACILAEFLRRRSSLGGRFLVWNGECWSLDGVAGAVRPMIDLGGGMLLAFVPDGSRRREWLAMGGEGAAMRGLRASLFSGQPAVRPGVGTSADRDR
jgi:hypothetical protein